jgi:hypothetical protein
MIDFVKHHLPKIAIGVVLMAIGLSLLIWQRHASDEAVVPGPVQEEAVPVQTLPEPAAQGLDSPRPAESLENVQQGAATKATRSPQAAADSIQPAQEGDGRAAQMADLLRKSTDLEKQIAVLQEEEQLRAQWKAEHLQMLEGHARRIADLGNTLQHVLKTPTQIRIMATDLESQAKGLRSQVATLSRVARNGQTEKAIWAEKRTMLEQQAMDLETIGLDLKRTQGEPSRVRIMAIRIGTRGQELLSSVENMTTGSTPSDNELLSLTRQLDSVRRELRQLQQK